MLSQAFYKTSWLAITPVVRVLFRSKYEGLEHVPKKGPAILASNHLSFLDHFILGAGVPRQIFFISKSQHFDDPIRRHVFSSWGVIPLKRGEGDRDAFDRSLQALRAGHLFAIYPEGTRSLDGKLHKGHTGVARLHLLSGAPVVPVAMWGTFQAMPKGATVPKLVPCGAKFGRPLAFPEHQGRGDDRDALRDITGRIMFAIRDLSGQEYVDEYQQNPEIKSHKGRGKDGGAHPKPEPARART